MAQLCYVTNVFIKVCTREIHLFEKSYLVVAAM